MIDQPIPGPSTRPWYRTVWGIVYLSVLGIALLVALVQAAIPAGGKDADNSPGKAANLIPVSIALQVLLAIAIGLMVFRRQFWRSAETGVNVLIGVVLFLLGTAAAVIFVFFGCWAASTF